MSVFRRKVPVNGTLVLDIWNLGSRYKYVTLAQTDSGPQMLFTLI